MVGLGAVIFLCGVFFCWHRRHHAGEDADEGANDPLNPTVARHTILPHAQTDYQLQFVPNVGERTAGVGAPSNIGNSAVDLLTGRVIQGCKGAVIDGAVVVSSSSCQLYDRSHVTGASSSSSSGPGYPQETLNPPPSPATGSFYFCIDFHFEFFFFFFFLLFFFLVTSE